MKLNQKLFSDMLPVILLLSLLVVTHTSEASQQSYEIALKNGNIIKTPFLEEKNGRVYFERFSSKISISKDQVSKITVLQGSLPSKTRLAVIPPKYIKVTGARSHEINGIFEERGKHNNKPVYRQIGGRHSIFYNHSRNLAIPSGWAIGEFGHSYTHILLVNPHLSEHNSPDTPALWTSSTAEITYPDVSLTEIPAPDTVNMGAQRYVAEDFPIPAFNGLYNLESISSGHRKYSHKNGEYKLYYYAKRWVIGRCKNRCSEQYQSAKLEHVIMPNELDTWYDLERRRISGKITTTP